jgi:hypothetical protein
LRGVGYETVENRTRLVCALARRSGIIERIAAAFRRAG